MKTKILLQSFLSIAIIFAIQIGIGGEPYIVEDRDGDDLCDYCEGDIFGTNREFADTDNDGILDGDEDHDGDGITNFEEQDKIVELREAVERGDIDSVLTLLEYGPYMYLTGGSKTPLGFAAYKGNIEMLTAILDAGVDVNERSMHRGETALMETCNIEALQALLNAGADVNAKNDYGGTALMHTVKFCTKESVKLLLEAGAEVNAQDWAGTTALKEAKRMDNTTIVDLLIEAGAEEF